TKGAFKVAKAGRSAQIVRSFFLSPRRQQVAGLADEFAGWLIKPHSTEHPLKAALKFCVVHSAQPLLTCHNRGGVSGVIKHGSDVVQLRVFGGFEELFGKILRHLQQLEWWLWVKQEVPEALCQEALQFGCIFPVGEVRRVVAVQIDLKRR